MCAAYVAVRRAARFVAGGHGALSLTCIVVGLECVEVRKRCCLPWALPLPVEQKSRSANLARLECKAEEQTTLIFLAGLAFQRYLHTRAVVKQCIGLDRASRAPRLDAAVMRRLDAVSSLSSFFSISGAQERRGEGSL